MKKEIKRWKMSVEKETRKQAEGLIHKLFTKWRLRERIDYANRWALRHKGKTLGWTVGLLFSSLFVGFILSLCQTGEAEQNPLTGIEKVKPMFDGLQSIQDRKTPPQSTRHFAQRPKDLSDKANGRTGSPWTADKRGTGFIGETTGEKP